MNRAERARIFKDLPTEVTSQCKQMAEDIRKQNEDVRDRKVFAARIRMCSGYYDSERVIRGIASRLISEVTS